VGPRAGPDTVEHRKISCPCPESNPGRSARSPSLYLLSYPGSYIIFNNYVYIFIANEANELKFYSPIQFSLRAAYASAHGRRFFRSGGTACQFSVLIHRSVLISCARVYTLHSREFKLSIKWITLLVKERNTMTCKL
jgi:hypothetical protein